MASQIETRREMAKILADRDIQKLLGVVLLDADPTKINPNGIEIRLGKHVLFQSTDEERELSPGDYLRVLPGESVMISSLEKFDFSRETIGKIFPGCDLMAFITPTTTMMREGIVQSATKIDSGWTGVLSWGLRHSSIRNFVLGYAEPIFKLTIFLLEEGETPQIPYGGRSEDLYQSTEGIKRSTRKIPVTIPAKHLIGSSSDKLDPAKQLREAGYPFDHISTELTDLHGKFEIVSKDVLLLKGAIGEETDKLSKKVEESHAAALQKVEHLFDRKMLGVVGRLVALGSAMYGLAVVLQDQGLSKKAVGAICILAGIGVWLVAEFLMRREAPKGPGTQI
jgi:deoxycytidine triphosphate deaminase